MKFTKAFVFALSAAVAFAVTAAVAEQDPVKTREDLMKQNDDHAKTMVQMMRGQRPFDAKLVDTAFEQWADTAKKTARPVPGKFENRRRQSRLADDLAEQGRF